jgi:HK97 family phage major capsid protein
MAQLSQKGRLEGLEAEMDQEARKEFASSGITPSGMLTVPGRVLMSSRTRRGMAEARAALLASEVGNGSNFVQTDVKDFISALYDKNVLTGLGARMVTGLIGNLQIPKSGGSTAVWEGETDANADGTPAVTNVSASPKRLGAYGLVSKQLLIQANNYDVEQLVQNDIINAINQALQVAGINGAGGDNDQPRGILNTDGIGDVIGGSTGAAPTAAHIIELEEKVATAKADIGTLAFLTNPKMRSKLKRTALDAGSGQFVWDLRAANDLMGYRAGVTTSVPSNLVKTTENLSAIIFGNFADMLILQWGGFDIVLNPYTLAKTNQMEIVINSYWDVVIRNAVSFAAMKDAITT